MRNGLGKGLQRAVSCFRVHELCGGLRLVVFVGSPLPQSMFTLDLSDFANLACLASFS